MAAEDLFDLDQFLENVDDDSTFELSSSTEKKKTPRPKKKQVKPRVRSEWSDDEMLKLISCVECVPILWNAKEERYRNKVERQAAWKQISEADFDNKFSANELMAKWSNMRIQYRSYLSKYRKSKSGQGSNEPVKWKFYEAMDFVGRAEAEQTAATVSNLINTDERSLDSPTDRGSTHTPQVAKRKPLSESSSVTTDSSSAAHIVAEGMRDAVNQLKEQRQKREDKFDAFGKYVATELRCLSDPNVAQRVRFKVARFLMDCIEAENQSASQDNVLDESSMALAQLQPQQQEPSV